MTKYMVNPNKVGCLEVIHANSPREAEISAMKRFGLNIVWLIPIDETGDKYG